MGHRVSLAALAAIVLVCVLGCGGSQRGKLTFLSGTTISASECPSSGCGVSGRATLNTLLRHYWWGHGRVFVIHRSGRGQEAMRTYIQTPTGPSYIRMGFKVIAVTGTPATANALVRVTSVSDYRHTLWRSGIRVGRLDVLRLRHGVITDSKTHATFCAPAVDRCGL